MDILQPDELRQLTPEELRRLHRSLAAFTKKQFGQQVIGAGFGAKFVGGQRDARYPWAARFLVHHKYVPSKPSEKIPQEVSFRLRRADGRYVLANFVTDVQATGGEFEPTAVRLDDPYRVMAGLTLRWSGPYDDGERFGAHWGILTVGHAFYRLPMPQPVRVGRLVSQPAPSWIHGHVTQATHPRQVHDAAIIECAAADLRLSGLLPRPDRQLWVKDEAALVEDVRLGAAGASLRTLELETIPLTLQTYLHQHAFDEIGSLVHVIQAEGRAGDFAPGTSGCIWTVDGIPVAMQVGSYRPEYRVGVAQALFSVIGEWYPQATQSTDAAAVHVF